MIGLRYSAIINFVGEAIVLVSVDGYLRNTNIHGFVIEQVQ
jgi:hypothetical protein